MALAGVGSLLGCQAGALSPARTSHVALSAPEAHGRAALLSASARGSELRAGLHELAARVRAERAGIVGLGSGVFDKAGRADRRPAGLTEMESFPGDVFEPARAGADVVVQVDGRSPERAAAALESVLNGLDEFEVTWQCVLSRQQNESVHGRAVNRNVFGFAEGFANAPVRDDASAGDGSADAIALVAPGPGQLDWAVGGSFLALRVLTVSHDLWDADPVEVQEQIVGRRRDGSWLDGSGRFEEPDFAADPEGAVTPLDSHVRLANPRDGSPAPRLLRRSWTWSSGDDGAQPGEGLLFMAFQADLDEFRLVQERLAGERLSRYVLATGGGYFFVPPDRVGERVWEDVVLG